MADDASIAMMQSVTGAPSDTCAQYLLATNGDIDAAVGLFFAAGGESATAAPLPEQAARRPSPRAEDDIGFVTPQVASTLADGGGGGGGGDWDAANYAYSTHASAGPGPGGIPSLEEQLAMATANMQRLQHGGSAAASAWGGGRPAPTNRTAAPESGLDAMFMTPSFGFTGTFHDAVKHAAKQGQWLLVSLTDDSFTSGCLNRDVLSNEVVKELLQCNYVLWQTKLGSAAGSAVADTYRVAARGLEAPVTLIIHPLTRAELGMIKKSQLLSSDPSQPLDPMRMQDALLNFADTRPAPVVPTTIDDSDSPSAASTPVPAGTVARTPVDANEDPELAAALALSEESYQKETAGQPSAAVVDVDDDESEAAEHAAAAPTEDVDLEAQAVDPSTEGAFRLRVRLPAGPWNLVLPGSLPFAKLVEGVRTRLRNDGQSDTSSLSLQVGFPPKKIYQPGDDVPSEATLAGVGTIRSGDVITPHL